MKKQVIFNTSNRCSRIFLKSLIMIVGLLTSFSAANAITIDNTFDGGTISLVGDTVQGSGILFDIVTDTDIGLQATLDFQTGSIIGDNGNGGTIFEGGTFTLSGDVDTDNDGTLDIIGEEIFTGTFGQTVLFQDVIPFFGTQQRFMTIGSNSYTGEFHSNLLTALGHNSPIFEFDLSVIGMSGVVNESDIVLTAVPSTGSTVTMLGLGLAIIGFASRRNK